MADFFYGLEPRWSGGDRLFRVYVLEDTLVGAYVAGQVYDMRSAAHQLQALALPLRPAIRKWLVARQEREARYDAMEPLDPAMLRVHEHNFRIARSKVVRARFRRNRSLWTPSNRGVVAFELCDGTERKFILVGDQPQDDVLVTVRRFAPRIEVIGRRRALRVPTATPSGVVRSLVALQGAMLVGIGAFSGARSLASPEPFVGDWLIPVACSVLGVWCLMTALKLLD